MEIKGEKLNDELVMEIGKFSILWNCFERFQCDNNCNAEKIRFVCSRIGIDKDKQAELAKVLNERRSWFGQSIPEYVGTGLYPGNARQNRPEDRMAMEQFMKQEGDDYYVVYEKNPMQVPFYKVAEATSKMAACKKAKLLQVGYNICKSDMQ